MDTANEASGQAAEEPVIVPTSAQDGQAPSGTSFVPKKESASENEQAKKQRISNQEWQERTEKANEAQQLKETVKETLGVEPDQLTTIAKQLLELQEENRRKDWEAEHPVVRSEKYKDKWLEVNKNPKYAQLDYEERLRLIRDDADAERVSRVKEELKAQEHQSPGIPFVSKGDSPKAAVNPESLDLLRAAFPGMTEKEAMELG